jgi:hypothetical protein
MVDKSSKNPKGREITMTVVPWRLASDPTARYKAVILGAIVQVSTPGRGFYSPAYSDYVDLFYSCIQKWKSETYFTSSIDEILEHPSILRIVKIGAPMISLILHEIGREPSVLCFVLEDIVGYTPYNEEDIGNIKALCDAWIAWGERNDY